MKLTKNFRLNEFDCKDGTTTPADLLDNLKELAINLQVLRDELDRPIHIMSGYRTPEYNKRVGGAKKSQHVLAKAADIQVNGVSPIKVRALLMQLIADGHIKKGGIGIYKTFVHYDTRGRNARWGRIHEN